MNFFKCVKNKSEGPSAFNNYPQDSYRVNKNSSYIKSNLSLDNIEDTPEIESASPLTNSTENIDNPSLPVAPMSSSTKYDPSTTAVHVSYKIKSKVEAKEIVSLPWTSNSMFSKLKRKFQLLSRISNDNEDKNFEENVSTEKFCKLNSQLVDSTYCDICFQQVSVNKYYQLKECYCAFCIECLRMYVDVKIGENAGIIPCPQTECTLQGLLTQDDVYTLTNRINYTKFLRIREEIEVNLDPNRIWCPIPDCGRIVVVCNPIIDGKPTSCPTCEKEFCAKCSTPWNIDHKCLDELKELSELIKRCPKCDIPIERNAGCAQIYCQQCQHMFCWHCLESIEHDLFLIHYNKGNCRGKLGHSNALVWTLRTAVIFGIIMTVAMSFIWAPLLLLAIGPCYLCRHKHFSHK